MTAFCLAFEDFVKASPLIASTVAVLAILNYNRINRKQIRAGKLEEMYASIYKISAKYIHLYLIYNIAKDYYNTEINHTNSINHYMDRRRKVMDDEGLEEMLEDALRLNLLIQCYTKGKLHKDLEEFKDMLLSFLKLLIGLNMIEVNMKWKKDFPNVQEYYIWESKMREKIVTAIGYN